MRAWNIPLVILLLLALCTPPETALAQAVPTEVLETTITHEMGLQITFRFLLQAVSPIENAIIFFQGQEDTHTNLGEMKITPQQENQYELVYVHKMETYRLRAFSEIEYRFEVRMQNGQTFTSPVASYLYDDNRFAWQTLQEGPFQIFWYEGDLLFAQSVLDTAQDGLLHVQELLPFSIPTMVKLYVYTDQRSMQDTLNPSSENWVAGHADPDLNVVVLALPTGPEQRMLMEQRIPHELMHIALYHATAPGYGNLPVWLNEGIASLAELYPNPDYRVFLEDAVARNTLLPMSSLCNSFSREASTALLSYAQAESFTKYIYQNHGSSGLQQLITTYANGVECERGAKLALGSTLTQLERQWQRDTLSKDTAAAAMRNLLPWLLALLAALAVPLVLILRSSLDPSKSHHLTHSITR